MINDQDAMGIVIIKELSRNISSVGSSINDLNNVLNTHSNTLSVLRAEFDNLSKNVEHLSTLVRDGNGLITRMALMELELVKVKTAESASSEARNRKTEMYVAIALGVLGAASGMSSLFVGK